MPLLLLWAVTLPHLAFILAGYGIAVLPWRGLRVWYRRRLPRTAAVVVLRLGRWPAGIPGEGKNRRSGGAFLIYTDKLQPKPRPGAHVVFRAGSYCVTQL